MRIRGTAWTRPNVGITAAIVVSFALAACDGGGALGTGAMPTTRAATGCLPGMTALVPRTLGQGLFSAIAWSGDDVIAAAEAGLQRFPLAGDPASTLTQATSVYGLVVADQKAYFSSDTEMGLYSVPLTGGTPTLLENGSADLSLAVTDGTAIFVSGSDFSVTRIAIADGSQTDLPLPHGADVDALALYAGVLYVAAQDLTSTSATHGLILKMPATGGTAQTIVSNIGNPWTLVADATGLYWSQDPPTGTFGDGQIVHAALDGTGQRTLANHVATSLALSDGDLYLTMGSLSKIPAGGGDEVQLVTGLRDPGQLMISDGNAAWVDPVSRALSDPTVPSLMTTCW